MAPPVPTKTAESTNATIFSRSTSTPSMLAALSFWRMHLSPKPSRERSTHTAAANVMIASPSMA